MQPLISLAPDSSEHYDSDPVIASCKIHSYFVERVRGVIKHCTSPWTAIWPKALIQEGMLPLVTVIKQTADTWSRLRRQQLAIWASEPIAKCASDTAAITEPAAQLFLFYHW